MHLATCLAFNAAIFDFHMQAAHIQRGEVTYWQIPYQETISLFLSLHPQADKDPNFRTPPRPTDPVKAGLDLQTLDWSVEFYSQNGLPLPLRRHTTQLSGSTFFFRLVVVPPPC